MTLEPSSLQDDPPVIGLGTLIALLASVTAGTLVAALVLPAWLPGLDQSLAGEAPKAYWYLSRASGLVAYGLLWLSMTMGVTITNRLARLWPGGPVAFDVHQHASLLGLAFGVFHGLILLGDRYAAYTPVQLLVPFAAGAYRPFWVGLGQVGFYGLAIVGLSIYVKRLIGTRAWRLIHFVSFGVYALTLLHAVFSGTDTAHPLVSGLYWLTGGSFLFLFVYRLLERLLRAPGRKAAALVDGR